MSYNMQNITSVTKGDRDITEQGETFELEFYCQKQTHRTAQLLLLSY